MAQDLALFVADGVGANETGSSIAVRLMSCMMRWALRSAARRFVVITAAFPPTVSATEIRT
jgi:hypothetical protein